MMNKKGPVLISLFMCIIVILTACVKNKEEEKESPSNIIVSNKDEIFELKVYLDKDNYRSKEIIHCYATVEYIGEEDSITIYSSDPLVGFSLKDDKYFDGTYGAETILMHTTFEKGKTVRFDYKKSGGWSEDDPNADFYKKFFSTKDLILPEGKYEISATIEGSLDRNDILNSKYSNSVASSITVTK